MVTSGQIDAQRLPRVAEEAVFVPLEDLRGTPHIVVDGVPLPGTVLSLSHRPGRRHARTGCATTRAP